MAHSSPTDTWVFDDQTWQRTADNSFRLTHYRGLDVQQTTLSPCELAELVGAHYWVADGEALYPGAFKHSPVSGTALPNLSAPNRSIWLPPLGNSPDWHCFGLRQTNRRIELPTGLHAEAEAEQSLPLPPPGEYYFLQSPFNTYQSLLLAINPSKAQLYLYFKQQWKPLTNADIHLTECHLPCYSWGLALHGETRLFLPTDDGLAILDINIFQWHYQLTLIPAHCLAAPVLLGDYSLVPVKTEHEKIALLKVKLDTLETEFLHLDDFTERDFLHLPLVEKRQAIWLGQSLQLQVRLNAKNQPILNLYPWQTGQIPRLELGSPYYKNGQFWQICYDEPSDQYQYVKLGREHPEKHPCRSPRLSSGTISFDRATQLSGPPWSDAEIANEAFVDYIVIPLLEMGLDTHNGAVLAVRVDWIKGLDELFGSPATLLAHYEWRGHDGSLTFLTQKLRQPWLAQFFVYAGWLYLYHPDLKQIPGWKLV